LNIATGTRTSFSTHNTAHPPGRTADLQMGDQSTSTPSTSVRKCLHCSATLARDNTDSVCSPCRKNHRDEDAPPAIPSSIWRDKPIAEALKSRHIGKVLRAYRHHPIHGSRPLPQDNLASLLNITQPQLSRTENGPPLLHLNRLAQYAKVLNIPSQLLWFDMPGSERNDTEPTKSNNEAAAPAAPRVQPWLQSSDLRQKLMTNIHSVHAVDCATRQPVRPDILEALESEANLIRTTLDASTVSQDRLTELELITDRLGQEVVTIDPTSLLPTALSNFRRVRCLLERPQRTKNHIRLIRVTSKLATVIGEITYNQGQVVRARDWWATSIQAAYEANDQNLADLALASMSYIPTYNGQSEVVLTLIQDRLDGPQVNTPAMAWLWATGARAHANLGDAESFEIAIDRCDDILSQVNDEDIVPGIFSFSRAKQAFYTADGYATLGNLEMASNAAKEALDQYGSNETTEPALVRLSYARVLAENGEFDEAFRQATMAITGPNIYINTAVRARISRFEDSLPADLDRPTEWQASHPLAA